MRVYLDNAASTPLEQEVLDVMLTLMKEHYGNPSSIHAHGRQSRAIVENARKTIARLLNVSPAEIFFTSGGTEADNQAIFCSIRDLGIRHAVTSRIEHHAVLNALELLEKEEKIRLSYVRLNRDGHIDLDHLEELLKTNEQSFVSLMHANNEIGNLLPMKDVGKLCEKYRAVFHSDTVQTMGHYAIDLQAIQVDFATCSAHKFHGPKGSGFIYINNKVKTGPFIHGGAQERMMRGGTENITGIAGLAKAMEIACRDLEINRKHIQGLKTYLTEALETGIEGVKFNGDAKGSSLYTVLNVLLPFHENAEMLLFNLDIQGISVSGGSACTSGSNQGSHVLKAMGVDQTLPSVRFSFSKFNTRDELDYCVKKLKELYE